MADLNVPQTIDVMNRLSHAMGDLYRSAMVELAAGNPVASTELGEIANLVDAKNRDYWAHYQKLLKK